MGIGEPPPPLLEWGCGIVNLEILIYRILNLEILPPLVEGGGVRD